eukprot:6181796-Pleurochrysis_carterae.AAC.4
MYSYWRETQRATALRVLALAAAVRCPNPELFHDVLLPALGTYLPWGFLHGSRSPARSGSCGAHGLQRQSARAPRAHRSGGSNTNDGSHRDRAVLGC